MIPPAAALFVASLGARRSVRVVASPLQRALSFRSLFTNFNVLGATQSRQSNALTPE
jgi:hypothetical protein